MSEPDTTTVKVFGVDHQPPRWCLWPEILWGLSRCFEHHRSGNPERIRTVVL